MGEILSHDVEFITDFMAVLDMKPGSHPQTFRVLHIASLIGSFAALHFKGIYDRVRPAWVCPALVPPVPDPGHSSFPSGHATQAHLMVACLTEVFDASALSAADRAALLASLQTLAARVARNREIAGLHYPSDSAGGSTLATEVHAVLAAISNDQDENGNFIKRYPAAIAAAAGEWP
jgi:membrane-associated phospholipid phosphatase